MELMLFPENSREVVIVPSNKEGTGFLNHCYHEKYLKGFLSENEFNAIVLICSRIAAKAYSMKQKVDRQEISSNMVLLIGFLTTLSIVGIVLLTFSAIYVSTLTEMIATIMLGVAILAMFILNIYAWKQGDPATMTFEKMVKDDLEEFFENVNSYYAKETDQGVRWSTIDGHYWIECHLDSARKIPD